MNILDFIASLLSSLAWPSAILILFIIFKKPLSNILYGVSSLKYKDFQLEIKEAFSQLETVAKSADLPEIYSTTTTTTTTPEEDRNIIQEKSEFENQFVTISEISPEAAISFAWSTIELELMSTVMRLGIATAHPSLNSAFQNLRLLYGKGYVNENTYELLNRMRALRNKAAHAHDKKPLISQSEAIEYGILTMQVLNKIKNI